MFINIIYFTYINELTVIIAAKVGLSALGGAKMACFINVKTGFITGNKTYIPATVTAIANFKI